MKITEKKLKKIIHEAIRHFVGGKDDEFDLGAYLDTIPKEEVRRQYEDFRIFDYVKGYCLTEGALNSEDAVQNAEYAASIIKRRFNLEDWQVRIEKGENDVHVIFVIPAMQTNTIRMREVMEQQNFFHSKTWTIPYGATMWNAMKFEPYSEPDISHKAKEKGYLYHLTPKYNVESILLDGLLPSNKSKMFKYPPRTYVMSPDTPPVLIQAIGEQLYANDSSNKKNNGEYALLRIEAQYLPLYIHFYGDPNFPYGYYTETLIPPEYISVAREFQFDLPIERVPETINEEKKNKKTKHQQL